MFIFGANIFLGFKLDYNIKRKCKLGENNQIIPQILINCKKYGCVGGDWNCIIDNNDATKNAAQKQSKSLKRLVKTFSWVDSFRQLHPNSHQFSRYYDNTVHGE